MSWKRQIRQIVLTFSRIYIFNYIYIVAGLSLGNIWINMAVLIKIQSYPPWYCRIIFTYRSPLFPWYLPVDRFRSGFLNGLITPRSNNPSSAIPNQLAAEWHHSSLHGVALQEYQTGACSSVERGLCSRRWRWRMRLRSRSLSTTH